MPPSDSDTGPVNLEDADFAKWLARLSWEKTELDQQYERRQHREGLFWHDPELDGLNDSDRKWAIVKMGFRCIAEILNEYGLLHYYEYFLAKGVTCPWKLRMVTEKYIRRKMIKITDPDEIEQILYLASNHMRDTGPFGKEKAQHYRFFDWRYGDVDQMMLECHQGRRFLSEKSTHEKWLCDQYDLTGPLHEAIYTFEYKWDIPKADYDDFDKYDQENKWLAATSADGFMFLFPMIEGDRAPPCVRCKLVHSMPCTDFVVDWKHMRTISCGLDNKCVLLDLEKDEVLQTIRDGHAEQQFICVDGNCDAGKLAVGANLGWCKVADIETNTMLMSLVGHTDHVRQVNADWDQNLVVTASWDSYVHVYDIRSAKLVQKLVGHNNVCEKMAVDFERQLVLSTAMEFRFILWEMRMGKLLRRYETPGHSPNSIDVDWENMRLATGADDGLIKIWDLASGEAIHALDAMHDMTLAIDVDWKKGTVATGSWDHDVDLWDLQTNEHIHQLYKPRRCLTQVRMTRCDEQRPRYADDADEKDEPKPLALPPPS